MPTALHCNQNNLTNNKTKTKQQIVISTPRTTNFYQTTGLDYQVAVSVISSDPPCKDGYVRFTTVPLKALFDQV